MRFNSAFIEIVSKLWAYEISINNAVRFPMIFTKQMAIKCQVGINVEIIMSTLIKVPDKMESKKSHVSK